MTLFMMGLIVGAVGGALLGMGVLLFVQHAREVAARGAPECAIPVCYVEHVVEECAVRASAVDTLAALARADEPMGPMTVTRYEAYSTYEEARDALLRDLGKKGARYGQTGELLRAARSCGQELCDAVPDLDEDDEPTQRVTRISLPPEAQRQFADALANPPPPNAALRRAFKRHAQMVDSDPELVALKAS